MKKKLMLAGCIFSLLIFGCKKDMPEDVAANTDQFSSNSVPENAARPGQCRLTSAVRDNAYGEFLQYNNRGLVSEWKEDYFDGLPFVVTYNYDVAGRLKTAHTVNNYAATETDTKYLYQGNRLIKQINYQAGTNTVVNETVNTYNNRGQIIKRGSTMFPVYCTFTYNLLGNNTVVNYYVDDALYLKEEFTYRQFNRNPYLAAYGIPYVTFAYDFLFSNFWETSEKYTFYDNGVGTVTGDLTPESAVLTLNQEKFLTSITNFDRVANENTSAYFTYDNCACANSKTINGKKASANSSAGKYIALTKFKQAFEEGNVGKIKTQLKTVISK